MKSAGLIFPAFFAVLVVAVFLVAGSLRRNAAAIGQI
jgi:hypothetical protein